MPLNERLEQSVQPFRDIKMDGANHHAHENNPLEDRESWFADYAYTLSTGGLETIERQLLIHPHIEYPGSMVASCNYFGHWLSLTSIV